MARPVRLVTFVGVSDDAGPRRFSVSARHEAVLDDARHVLLLDDRGWSEELRGPGADAVADIWAGTPENRIAETARVVVGPDEPFGDRTQADMETGHWDTLAATLRAHGVAAEGADLGRLPHDVVLSEPLLARIRRRT